MAVLISFLGGCQTSLHEICHDELVPFREEIVRRSREIQQRQERRPASGRTSQLLTSELKEEWLDWGLESLNRIQSTMDDARSHPEAVQSLDELSRMADHMVAYYGGVQQDNSAVMVRELRQVRRSLEKTQARICPNRLTK